MSLRVPNDAFRSNRRVAPTLGATTANDCSTRSSAPGKALALMLRLVAGPAQRDPDPRPASGGSASICRLLHERVRPVRVDVGPPEVAANSDRECRSARKGAAH